MLPSEEYGRRLTTHRLRVAQLEKTHIRLGNIRLAIAVLFVIIAWASLRTHSVSPYWLALPVALFAGIAFHHSRVLREQELARRAADFCERGLARIEDRWMGTGETGARFDDPHHVYASDLDLFGDASLFQLLSTARTRMGEDTLANWLLAPSPAEGLRERHAAVSELRDQLDLREDLAVLGADASVGVHPEELTAWAESTRQLKSQWMRKVAPWLAGLAVAAVAAWAYWGTLTPLVVVVAIEAILTRSLRNSIEEVLHGTEHTFRDLNLLSGVMARVERQQFETPLLRSLQASLASGSVPASQAIARLSTLVDLINSRHNTMVRLIDAPLMYSVQVTFAAEKWRQQHGRAVASWLSSIGGLEALLSLAAYSFEHPADVFPEFGDGTAFFECKQIGHPLVPTAKCVRNDVQISGETRVLLVSGSNMSGKSTLLRAIGTNVVLAMAGGPVRAQSLRLTQLQVGASIRVNDSLREGSSRFYAEITRLRQIFGVSDGSIPLLFLLDELLQGTNSKDRRIGAEGVVRALVNRGAIGLVSTHDLALTDIGGAVQGHLRNVHFQDEFENGRITFDYILRDGVVTKSNGIELMRSIGLDV